MKRLYKTSQHVHADVNSCVKYHINDTHPVSQLYHNQLWICTLYVTYMYTYPVSVNDCAVYMYDGHASQLPEGCDPNSICPTPVVMEATELGGV